MTIINFIPGSTEAADLEAGTEFEACVWIPGPFVLHASANDGSLA